MAFEDAFQAALQRLVEEDAVGQLRRRDGLMARLGSEGGAPKLDWVEAAARLLDDPAGLESVEAEARAMRERGIRHVIWAGMGGSVLTVRVLRDLGFCGDEDGANGEPGRERSLVIHPLDSTDPAALNAVVRAIADAKGLALPETHMEPMPAYLQALLGDVLMVGVAMGMTSEEPITHLRWFGELLERAGLPASEHILVMTLPGSYLDTFAREHHASSRALQLDGGSGTGGRMSAPGTRVFLLPAALALTALTAESGQLRWVLQQAWSDNSLELAVAYPDRHPFVRLAAALSAASRAGTCRLVVDVPEVWHVFVPWLEQLMEESLGKGGKGVVVFGEQALDTDAPGYRDDDLLRVHMVIDASATAEMAEERTFILPQPPLVATEPRDRLAAFAASCLGWQLTMALYGYLHQIPFAGQPAVENYKARARELREQADPLEIATRWQPAVRDGRLTLLAPTGTPIERAAEPSSPGAALAHALRGALAGHATRGDNEATRLGYLDVTINGVAPAAVWSALEQHTRTIGNRLLGVPVKLRQAPAAYHSTEQSEMDGPPEVMSLRLVARTTQVPLLGTYTTQFLHAQAVSTWQAMLEAGRPCYLLVLDGSLEDAQGPLGGFFSDVERWLGETEGTYNVPGSGALR